MFNVNSPFAGLSQTIYSPQSTASTTSSGIGDLSRAFNMTAMAKNQPLNTGLTQNINAMRRGQGAYDARRQFVPMNQRLQDSAANAQWGLGVQSANESAGLQGMNHLMNQTLNQQRQDMANRGDAWNLLSRMFNPSDLFGF